jgi:hypothetical protein
MRKGLIVRCAIAALVLGPVAFGNSSTLGRLINLGITKMF